MKSISLSESILREPALQIRELGRQVSSPTPFTVELRADSLRFSIPTYCSIHIEDGWFWELVHSGQRWGEHGIQADHANLTLAFPLQSKIKISAQGRTWMVNLRARTSQPIRSDLMGTLRQSRFLGISLLGHANLLFLLWVAVSHNINLGILQPSNLTPKTVTKTPVVAATSGQPSEVVVSRPFEGMHYSEFLRRADRAQQESDPLGYLAKSLGNTKSGAAGGTARVAGLQSATGSLGSGIATAEKGKSLTEAVSHQQFSVQPNSSRSEKISDQQRIALREKFRDIQDDFKRVYSKLLVQDPTLSVTVAYSARVAASGYLELADFKARGNYSATSLPQLKSAMAEIIRGVYIGPELAGVVLRAENVFMR